MGTVVFDFDSTLITHESLDELLARLLAGDTGRVAEVRAITDAGMAGEIPFRESLARRLAIAAPTRAQAEALGQEARGWLTPGLGALVRGLDAQVWIISGGLVEVLLPTAADLGIPPERVLGTRVTWTAAGALGEVDARDKVEQLRGRTAGWARPRVMIGDGMTDHAPLAAGLVDHFVAFTANVRREAVVATGAPEAAGVRELEYLLDQWL